MPLSNLTPSDTFDIVESKLDDTIDAVNEFSGGTTGQIWTKDSATDFDGSFKGPIVSSSSSAITYSTGWAGTVVSSIDVTGEVELSGELTISTGGTTTLGTISATYKPISSKRFTISDYNGSEGASAICVLDIASDGTITMVKQSDGTKPVNRSSFIFTVRYSSLI